MFDVSVVTVNLNNSFGLKLTLDSVLSQTCKNMELIVIDGGSSDSSFDIIQTYSRSINCWTHEKDNGVYDAMNKGIAMANGVWTIFMNSGDIFYDENTIERITFDKKIHNKDVLYGSVILKDAFDYLVVEPSPLCTFFYKLPFCHQSSLIKTKLLKELLFDNKYRISADYDLFCRAFINKNSFYRLNFPIAIFDNEGISSIYKEILYVEYQSISNNLFKGFFRKKLLIQYYIYVLKSKLRMLITNNIS